MTLLALETATATCGVAVLNDDGVVAEAHLHRPRVHAERLTPLIEDVLGHADVSTEALNAVAVSMGPGSYTGLRIGTSTAKGWALSADAAFVGVPTLEAYAARVGPMAAPEDVVCALLDARRDEVYAGAFRRTTEGLAEHAPTTALPVETLPDWLGTVDGQLWLVGDGAPKSRDALADDAFSCVTLPADAVSPSAGWVARRGRQRLEAHGPDDAATAEPLYVKDVHATPALSPFD
ncbi:tRNA (adenosine(37)-N6)-threonylcarbamoyltransferase complex dimerization subunit type 1 TsaB [Salinibacter altiplanensis]|uniref:tRNA (adenosine(37)-N6)-threonylcarbamoyltransferase complex dimerization subunit type 1 TsaB n=1 Tax=Salinibacter altiplanensis TaxID=1803181 RepID=UPI000C9FBBA0|nr:tRNA (adenosine(37)-N6)-threonylcarbamoyltransferase complex dimerization subunit type 1 TsaB [Salinibacter altiplanensis]